VGGSGGRSPTFPSSAQLYLQDMAVNPFVFKFIDQPEDNVFDAMLIQYTPKEFIVT